MVQAFVKLNDETNRILNILKAKYGLNDKSEAINLMAHQYKQEILEPELRPAYIKKAKKIMKEEPIPIGTSDDFKKRYEKKNVRNFHQTTSW